MKNLVRSCTYAACLLIGTAAGAQFQEPPTIITTTIDRSVWAEAMADEQFCDRNEILGDEEGGFAYSASVTCTGMYGSGGIGMAEQDTQISSYSITGTGKALRTLWSASTRTPKWVSMSTRDSTRRSRSRSTR